MVRPSVEDERRAQIMAATRRVMVQRGVSMLRVADVAREAGVSPGIVHYYFASKDELIRETFEDNFASSLERRASILDEPLPADEKLDALLGSYVPLDEATRESWHVWLELWVGALQDERLRQLNDDAYDEWRSLMGSVIAEGIEQGVFETDDLRTEVNQLVSMIDGLAVQALLGSSVISADEMHRICREFVRDHLIAR
ncbi:TetR/AcrR family transcriptional regulator [Leucobacter tenebrionis]|uniref:TetR/AcrR family transcriptional regulator n=1 Tax=Leucobacter tenebrionis TaxID=2873270 RepID=UPI001CA64411|nr:TetR/AcrR family transcriptional regulator [Leucobacter tenebrionis]QZY52678.1 TetR family transcriptional regulator [Leucobacter tenebrionis]